MANYWCVYLTLKISYLKKIDKLYDKQNNLFFEITQGIFSVNFENYNSAIFHVNILPSSQKLCMKIRKRIYIIFIRRVLEM